MGKQVSRLLGHRDDRPAGHRASTSAAASTVVRFSRLPRLSRPLCLGDHPVLFVDRLHDIGSDPWTISNCQAVTLTFARNGQLAGALVRIQHVRSVVIEGPYDGPDTLSAQFSPSLCLRDVECLQVRNVLFTGTVVLQQVRAAHVSNCGHQAVKGIVAEHCGSVTLEDARMACSSGCVSLQGVGSAALTRCALSGGPEAALVPPGSYGVLCLAQEGVPLQRLVLQRCRLQRVAVGVACRGALIGGAKLSHCRFECIPRTALLFHLWAPGQGVQAFAVKHCVLCPDCELGVYMDHIPGTRLEVRICKCRWGARRACSRGEGAPAPSLLKLTGMPPGMFAALFDCPNV